MLNTTSDVHKAVMAKLKFKCSSLGWVSSYTNQLGVSRQLHQPRLCVFSFVIDGWQNAREDGEEVRCVVYGDKGKLTVHQINRIVGTRIWFDSDIKSDEDCNIHASPFVHYIISGLTRGFHIGFSNHVSPNQHTKHNIHYHWQINEVVIYVYKNICMHNILLTWQWVLGQPQSCSK